MCLLAVQLIYLGPYPNLILLLTLYVSFLCGLAKKGTFNLNHLGKLSKVGSVYFQGNIIKTSGSQAGCVGFSHPHLTPERFKWYELPSFSNKKTF